MRRYWRFKELWLLYICHAADASSDKESEARFFRKGIWLSSSSGVVRRHAKGNDREKNGNSLHIFCQTAGQSGASLSLSLSLKHFIIPSIISNEQSSAEHSTMNSWMNSMQRSEPCATRKFHLRYQLNSSWYLQLLFRYCCWMTPVLLYHYHFMRLQSWVVSFQPELLLLSPPTDFGYFNQCRFYEGDALINASLMINVSRLLLIGVNSTCY